MYRAPYGEYNDTVIKAATDKGYHTIQWNLDTLDYTGLTRRRDVETFRRKTKSRGYYFKS